MRIKEGYMLREVAGNYVVVPVGKASREFNGVITLNSTGAFIWSNMLEDTTLETLIEKLMEEYEVEKEVATRDVEKYIDILVEENLVE